MNQFSPGDEVIILVGKRRIGVIVGLRRSHSETYPYARYVVRVGGEEKSYLPNTLKAVEKKGDAQA